MLFVLLIQSFLDGSISLAGLSFIFGIFRFFGVIRMVDIVEVLFVDQKLQSQQ
jgi:hypothetical protein